jgi:hypothetical protein
MYNLIGSGALTAHDVSQCSSTKHRYMLPKKPILRSRHFRLCPMCLFIVYVILPQNMIVSEVSKR